METTVCKSRRGIFPLIFFLVFLAITALATVVTAANQAQKIGSGETVGEAIG